MGRLILSVNTSTLDAGFTKDMAEFRITATSLGTSTLEYVQALSFDESTADTFLTNTQLASLTGSPLLGPDAGESGQSLYDDIDDYNNFIKFDTLQNSAIFKTRTTVNYIDVTSTAMTVTTAKTWVKQITVEVTSDFLVDHSVAPPRPDTLKFRTIFSYWYFR